MTWKEFLEGMKAIEADADLYFLQWASPEQKIIATYVKSLHERLEKVEQWVIELEAKLGGQSENKAPEAP